MQSPLHEAWVALGGRYGDTDAWDVADDFGDPAAEYEASRHGAAAIDVSRFTRVELRGADRARFLHNLCTNDVKGLPAGRGREAFLTSGQGRTLAHVWIWSVEDVLWIDSFPGVAAPLVAHLERYRIADRVEIADRSADFGRVGLVGPRAREVLAALAPLPELGDLARTAGIPIGGVPCSIARNDLLALPTYELSFPAAQSDAVWKRFWEVASAAGTRTLGRRGWEALRIEAGLPLYGVDVDAGNFPQEVGRDQRAISYGKGCYLGQETVARIRSYGHVNRHLVGFELPGAVDLAHGTPVRRDEAVIGQLTSAAVLPGTDRTVALGYVRRGHEEPGTPVTIELPGDARPAVVRALPGSRLS